MTHRPFNAGCARLSTAVLLGTGLLYLAPSFSRAAERGGAAGQPASDFVKTSRGLSEKCPSVTSRADRPMSF